MNFDLGPYGVYIWPAYGISAAGIACAVIWTLRRWAQAKARLKALEEKK
jgi:heme exporter protein CcmD